jgi:hypothetical protein
MSDLTKPKIKKPKRKRKVRAWSDSFGSQCYIKYYSIAYAFVYRFRVSVALNDSRTEFIPGDYLCRMNEHEPAVQTTAFSLNQGNNSGAQIQVGEVASLIALDSEFVMDDASTEKNLRPSSVTLISIFADETWYYSCFTISFRKLT